jgi:hypothetical protein
MNTLLRIVSCLNTIASELEIEFHPYGAAQHCRYRQNIPRGLPRGMFNELVG